jgi:hypothetical protein
MDIKKSFVPLWGIETVVLQPVAQTVPTDFGS